MRTRTIFGPLLVAVAVCWWEPRVASCEELHEQPQLRRPVAIVAVDESVFVANRRSGSISQIDAEQQRVVREMQVGTRLADLDATPDGRFLLAVDEGGSRILILRRDRYGLEVTGRLELPATPVDLCLVGEETAVVASLWSKTLSVLSLDDASDRLSASVVKSIPLPFAPRKQTLVGDTHLIVADAFGGRLAIVDLQRQTVAAVRSFHGHNIRGMAVSSNSRELLVTHQILDSKMSTTHESIFWGGLMSNVLQSFPLKALLEADPDVEVGGYLYPLGRPSDGTGDPADVLVTPAGETIIALSGIDEVALRARPLEPFVRRYVGRLPTALTAAPDGRTVYIANTLDDSITLLDLSDMRVAGSVSLGPQPVLSAADRGESLFYNARLSLDGWFSCHSCHTDGHTNGLLNDNLSDGHFGAPKRIPSLRGVAQTGPWAWNGGIEKLESQVRNSMEKTMLGTDITAEQVTELAAFLQELETIPNDEASQPDEAAIERGRVVFGERRCSNCHAPPTFTSANAYDVGIVDEQGTTRFNPPSLRGVSQRGPFFHDNRATALRDVFIEFGHGRADGWDSDELDDLLAFLRSL